MAKAKVEKSEPETEVATETVMATEGGKPGDLVKVKANPALNRGCHGQVIVNNRVVTTEGVMMTRKEFDALSIVEIRGVPAVVLA